MSKLLWTFVVWFLLPMINYFVFKELGLNYGLSFSFDGHNHKCPSVMPSNLQNISSPRLSCTSKSDVKEDSAGSAKLKHSSHASFSKMLNTEFNSYRGDEFATLKHPTPYSMIYNPHSEDKCLDYTSAYISSKVPHCFGIVTTKNSFHTHNLLRYNTEFKRKHHDYTPSSPQVTGYFKNVASSVGRIKMRDKMIPFLQHYDEIKTDITLLMTKRKINIGDDVVVMVANDGEIDLFLNFVCSSQAHNISTHNIIVFSASR